MTSRNRGRFGIVPKTVHRIYDHVRAREPNLVGDRDIERAWIAANLPRDSGLALDFGNGGTFLGLAAAERGFDVLAVDLEAVSWPYEHPRLRFLQGDILSLPLEEGSFDLVLNCSTVEHVGLAGRYAVTLDRPDGDLEAMRRLHALMKPRGCMLLTIPVGRDSVFAPWCRVYGDERLPRLLEGYDQVREAYWVKDRGNRWQLCARDVALSFEPDVRVGTSRRSVYALGLFVLRVSE